MNNTVVVCYNMCKSRNSCIQYSPVLFNCMLFSVKLKKEERSNKSSKYNLFEKREGQKERDKETHLFFYLF